MGFLMSPQILWVVLGAKMEPCCRSLWSTRGPQWTVVALCILGALWQAGLEGRGDTGERG